MCVQKVPLTANKCKSLCRGVLGWSSLKCYLLFYLFYFYCHHCSLPWRSAVDDSCRQMMLSTAPLRRRCPVVLLVASDEPFRPSLPLALLTAAVAASQRRCCCWPMPLSNSYAEQEQVCRVARRTQRRTEFPKLMNPDYDEVWCVCDDAVWWCQVRARVQRCFKAFTSFKALVSFAFQLLL